MLYRRPKPNKKLRYSLFALTALSLSACALNMKPEPPQSYQSFKQRRAPVENAAAESSVALATQQNQNSTLGQILNSAENPQASVKSNEPAKKPSMWTRLKNKFLHDDQSTNQASNPTQSLKPTVQQHETETEGDVRRPMQNYGYTNTSSNEDVKTKNNTFANMWDRLKGAVSVASNDEKPNATSVDLASKRTPIENHIEMAQLGVSQSERFAQGSTAADGYSQYDLAEEILTPAPVAEVKTHKLAEISNVAPKPVVLASNDNPHSGTINASASLVDVQEAPTDAEIAKKAESVPKPDLREVPKAPKPASKVQIQKETTVYKNPKKYKKPQQSINSNLQNKQNKAYVKQHKGTETSHLSRENNREEMGNVVIKDESAKIIYKNGKPIVSGFIG